MVCKENEHNYLFLHDERNIKGVKCKCFVCTKCGDDFLLYPD